MQHAQGAPERPWRRKNNLQQQLQQSNGQAHALQLVLVCHHASSPATLLHTSRTPSCSPRTRATPPQPGPQSLCSTCTLDLTSSCAAFSLPGPVQVCPSAAALLPCCVLHAWLASCALSSWQACRCSLLWLPAAAACCWAWPASPAARLPAPVCCDEQCWRLLAARSPVQGPQELQGLRGQSQEGCKEWGRRHLARRGCLHLPHPCRPRLVRHVGQPHAAVHVCWQRLVRICRQHPAHTCGSCSMQAGWPPGGPGGPRRSCCWWGIEARA